MATILSLKVFYTFWHLFNDIKYITIAIRMTRAINLKPNIGAKEGIRKT